MTDLRGPIPTPRGLGFRMPAEWERQEAVWLVWPRDPLTWPGRVGQARGTFLHAMKAVTPHQRVDLVVHQDSWIRNYGPIYLTKGPPERRERIAVRFGFNAWGNKYESLLKDRTVI